MFYLKNKQTNKQNTKTLKLPRKLIKIKQGGDVKLIYFPLASNGKKE